MFGRAMCIPALGLTGACRRKTNMRLMHQLRSMLSSLPAPAQQRPCFSLSWLRASSARHAATISHTDPRVQAYAVRARTQLAELERRLTAQTGSTTRAEDTRQQRKLAEIVSILDQLDAADEECRQLTEMTSDPELREMALQDVQQLTDHTEMLQASLLLRLAGPAPVEECSALLEITAGVGGQEAMLFASELLDMYVQYAASHGWRLEVATGDATELGGVRYAAATVHGAGVYGRLRHEGGVHRVQRIPRTERSGRLHTSTAAVAVLPLPDEVEVQLPASDLRIETKRASGAGGQHVNTTDSAVRVIHLPTGMAVDCQQTRSQHKNRERALEILRARLYQIQLDKAERERSAARKQQMGSSGRSEKVRTYNYPQDRVTDHRCGVSLHGLPQVLTGQKLDHIIDALCERERWRRVMWGLEE